MSVIGRLDEQVAAVLINSVAGKSAERDEKEQRQEEAQPARPHTPEQPHPAVARAKPRRARAASDSVPENDLPVWLL